MSGSTCGSSVRVLVPWLGNTGRSLVLASVVWGGLGMPSHSYGKASLPRPLQMACAILAGCAQEACERAPCCRVPSFDHSTWALAFTGHSCQSVLADLVAATIFLVAGVLDLPQWQLLQLACPLMHCVTGHSQLCTLVGAMLASHAVLTFLITESACRVQHYLESLLGRFCFLFYEWIRCLHTVWLKCWLWPDLREGVCPECIWAAPLP